MTLKVIDLFCGCGGFSLGFDYLDQSFEIIYALDNWDTACKSYKANFPYVDVDCRDALNINPKEIPKADIIIGGPPCQEFTICKTFRRGKTKDTRTFDVRLINWFLSVIEKQKPKYWIMENVPVVQKFLPESIPKKIYKMNDYGVPQIRKRLFAGHYNEPKKELCKIRFPTVINEAGGFIYRPPNLGFRLGAVFRRRALIYEAKMIQTFPLDFILYGTLSEQYAQIGNAVPPLMSYHLAKALLEVES